jgi:benzoate/toluate 1,2-dioxygenase reductase subunit
MIKLQFEDGDRAAFLAKSGETVLAAARRAGIPLSSDCEVGDCQTCRATCVAGEIEYDELATVSLNQSEIDAGEILPCVASAATNLEIRVPYERGKLIAAKPFSIKVQEIRRLSASVVRLTADVLGLSPLKFLPGQYVNLQVPGTSEWRSYSMANAPGEKRTLEFLVRVLDDGIMSRYLTERAAPGDIMQCRGPQGTFYLRNGARPILMIAGGTGVAPMMSMLRQMIATGERRSFTLCFGVNEDRDLFYVDELSALAKNLLGGEVRIAIAQGTSRIDARSGLVTDLLTCESLMDVDIYLCGPPAMTDRAREIVLARGACSTSIFSERFCCQP